MKIIFLTDQFPPERNVPATRTWEHVSRWAKAGHEVTIITTAPNHPEGKLLNGYKNRWYATEMMEAVKVIRVKSYITANKGVFKRTLDYLSFMVTGCIAAMFQPRPDVLVATSPQFFCAVAGWVAATVRRVPWVFELRDLWPESIVAVGAMKESLAIRALTWVEMSMYRSAARVVAVTNGLKQDLVDRGIDPDKIHVVRNGCDITRFYPRPKDETLLERFGLKGKFVAGYFGTIGMAAGVDTAVQAAELLQDRDDIMILLAGAGAEFENVQQLIKARGLRNIQLLPAFSQAEMPTVLSVLDAGLVMLKDKPLFRGAVSTKISESLASGKPVILSMPEGEATGLLDEYGFGLKVKAETPEEMANALRRLADDRALHGALAEKALTASRDFSRERSADALIQVLQGIVSEDGAHRRSA